MGSNTFKIKDKNQKNLASVSGKSKKKIEKIKTPTSKKNQHLLYFL